MDRHTDGGVGTPAPFPSSRRPRAGAVAACGALAWTLAPTLALAAYGTRPYGGTGFDLLALVGWLGVGIGALGLGRAFGPSPTRVDRAGLGLFALGWVLLAGLHARSAAAYVAAGFTPVPATGEDPAGLLLTWLFLSGYAAVLLGTGALGLAVRARGEGIRTAAGWLLLVAPAVPAVLVLLDLLRAFPPAVGRVLVTTNAALVPLGIAWIAVGVLLWLGPGRGDRSRSAERGEFL
ncbi:hypothetical protein [Haloparvum sedimenti]|uniref:hypothetical protein n=1 Tax=Haloparvum sedimenti TaxID=1678448 RepID=UPI00071E8910|nr:hypothetical protein [Haloparvum sedimenti]